jgi:ABC-type Fe3+ transport system permease subunit
VAAAAHADSPPRTAEKPRPVPGQHDVWPMKNSFVLVALSLMLSTVTDFCMAWRLTRHRRRYGLTLAAGVVVPVLLMRI